MTVCAELYQNVILLKIVKVGLWFSQEEGSSKVLSPPITYVSCKQKKYSRCCLVLEQRMPGFIGEKSIAKYCGCNPL